MSDQVPLFEIDWGRDEVTNVVDSVTRGGYWAKGPYVERFEDALAAYHDVDNAIVCNSGTTALTMALSALDVGEGDEVIVPSFTFIATANAVKLCGATPVFVDIERERFGLDPAKVREAITERTTAILPVHYAGSPCRIHELAAVAAEHDLALVEDVAEAQGASADGELVGGIGETGVLSFCQNKIITTGEGGAVLTDDSNIAEHVELVRSHGRVPGDYFDSADSGAYVRSGSNYRMPDICAALGAAQIDKIESVIDRRRTVANRYNDAFEDMDRVEPMAGVENGRSVYQLYTVVLDDTVDREAVIESLSAASVSSKVYFEPVHKTRYYRSLGYEQEQLPTTESLSERVLSLPIYPTQDEETTARVVAALESALDDAA